MCSGSDVKYLSDYMAVFINWLVKTLYSAPWNMSVLPELDCVREVNYIWSKNGDNSIVSQSKAIDCYTETMKHNTMLYM